MNRLTYAAGYAAACWLGALALAGWAPLALPALAWEAARAVR